MTGQPLYHQSEPAGLPAVYRSGVLVETHQTVAITVLGLRALRARGEETGAQAAAFLEFLEAAMSNDGTFAFWPDNHRPVWATGIPRDVDDTAMAVLELYLQRRISRSRAVRIVATTILPQRVRPSCDIRPPWIADGAFETWLVPRGMGDAVINVVDCVVNANVLALLSALGMTSVPGWREAIRTLQDALVWARSDPIRLRTLTPFYPHPYELRAAAENAVSCGCAQLASLLPQLAELAPQQPDPQTPICSAAYRNDGWNCAELHELRLTSGTKQP